MEEAEIDSSSIDSPVEIDRQLHEICGPGVGGVPPGARSEAALLFARMRKAFKDSSGKRVLGFRGFDEWARARQETFGLQRSHIFEWVRAGRYLLPLIGKDIFNNLGVMKTYELARLAKAGKQIPPEFLDSSSDMTHQVLRDKVDELLGTESSWLTDVKIETHEDAQAVLLKLGTLLGYETYTPDRPKRSQAFRGRSLGDFATLGDLPVVGDPEVMKDAKRIDVVWVERKAPRIFFEVEHTTNVTMGLKRMLQVIYVDAKFVVVGPGRAQSRFDREIETEPFSSYKHKYSFRAYRELRFLFRAASNFRKLRDSFLK